MRCLAALVMVAALSTACGDDPATVSDTGTSVPDTTASTTTTVPGTTTTAMPDTTASTTTTAVPATTTTTTTVAPLADGPETFVAQVDNDLGEYRTGDGERIRLLDDGVEVAHAGDIAIADDATVWVHWGVEDGWFSCEEVNGHLTRYDPDGAIVELGPGAGVALAPDQTRVAWRSASVCATDPTDANFVVASLDTVVVTDRVSGEELRWLFPGADGRLDLVSDVVWVDDQTLVAVVDGRLATIDVADPTVPDPAALPMVALGGVDHLRLIGFDPDGRAVMIEGARRLVAIDVASGVVDDELATVDAADLDATGEHLATIVDGDLFLDGVELKVGANTSDGYVHAIGW